MLRDTFEYKIASAYESVMNAIKDADRTGEIALAFEKYADLLETNKEIFIASTTDTTVNLVIRAKNIEEAVAIANNEYSEEKDEVDFIFTKDNLKKISTIGKSEVIKRLLV
jgi:capsular polysaccharide biosynthesis protein